MKDIVSSVLGMLHDRPLEARPVDLAELVTSILALSSVTLRTTKAQLGHRAAALEPVPPGEEELLREVYSGPDFAEGVRAFLAKARPNFG